MLNCTAQQFRQVTNLNPYTSFLLGPLQRGSQAETINPFPSEQRTARGRLPSQSQSSTDKERLHQAALTLAGLGPVVHANQDVSYFQQAPPQLLRESLVPHLSQYRGWNYGEIAPAPAAPALQHTAPSCVEARTCAHHTAVPSKSRRAGGAPREARPQPATLHEPCACHLKALIWSSLCS